MVSSGQRRVGSVAETVARAMSSGSIRTGSPLPPISTSGTTASATTFWRVEGSLLDLSWFRPVAFFTWNSQSFSERWKRRGMLLLSVFLFPFLYFFNRAFAARFLHVVLRGVSRDRLDLLGEEYFQYDLRPQLKQRGVEALRKELSNGHRVVLVSHGLDHVVRPLANYLGVEGILTNRLEFRDGLATGRLLDPVVTPRGLLAGLFCGADGRVSADK